MTSATATDNLPLRDYRACIDLGFPTSESASQAMEVLSVDGEIGDKISKKFSVVEADCDENSELRVLRIEFEATEAKMLRVAVSSMYDSINVALKCFQEFGEQESA